MTKPNTTMAFSVGRERLIRKLNTDLAIEYKAIIAYIVYSQILDRAAHPDIASELELQAAEDFKHARNTASVIDNLGGTPCVRFNAVNTAPIRKMASASKPQPVRLCAQNGSSSPPAAKSGR